jgi:hypothetical protein
MAKSGREIIEMFVGLIVNECCDADQRLYDTHWRERFLSRPARTDSCAGMPATGLRDGVRVVSATGGRRAPRR